MDTWGRGKSKGKGPEVGPCSEASVWSRLSAEEEGRSGCSVDKQTQRTPQLPAHTLWAVLASAQGEVGVGPLVLQITLRVFKKTLFILHLQTISVVINIEIILG